MQRVGAEGDVAEVVAPRLVAALEIALEGQLAVAAHRQGVEVAQQAAFEPGLQLALQAGHKTGGVRRHRVPTHRHVISPKLDRAAPHRNVATCFSDSSAK